MITLDQLKSLVSSKAALRVITELQPLGGADSKIFPPTYSGSVYAETKNGDGKTTSVVLDSPQSQANRLEELLNDSVEDGDVYLPRIVTDLGDANRHHGNNGKLNSLTVPHRWADALLRDSVPSDNPNCNNFHDTEVYKSMSSSSWRDASAVFRYCPTSLLFGVWDSHGKNGGFGIKFRRCLTSVVTGYGVSHGQSWGGRLDPVGIEKDDFPSDASKMSDYYKKLCSDRKKKGKDDKGAKPSEIGHGNALVGMDNHNGGVVVDKILLSSVISLVSLRQYRFGEGKSDCERNIAARVVLAALGVFALSRQFEQGFALRSGCDLGAVGDVRIEVFPCDDDSMSWGLNSSDALELLKSSIDHAKSVGLEWQDSDIELIARKEMLAIMPKREQ